ncbi:hypothetical protein LZC95_24535 [Pendulispora brunnea]|uniref:Uncharacterized protein n=1 Tax=Pendulispora brunnea TaxID=2905690 RepID=A0ABZ2KQV9_9BACT
MRTSIACVLLLGVASCEQAPARKPPAEVPISEYRVEGPAPEAPPPDGKDDGGATPPPSTASSEKSEGSTTPATKLDAKNGFAGVQLGAPFKSFRFLKESERSGDHITYKVTRGTPSYGGVALKDVTYTFNKGKLDTIVFSVKANKDCKGMKESLERELGTPQSTSAQAQVWKGEKVGLRFAIAPNSSCGGSVVSRELADAISWAGLQP